MELTGVLTEDRWFGGRHRPKAEPAMCLGLAVEHGILGLGEKQQRFKRMAAIVVRLFPERQRRADECSPLSQVIRFNDHRETTWQEVQKVLREFDLEADLHDDPAPSNVGRPE